MSGDGTPSAAPGAGTAAGDLVLEAGDVRVVVRPEAGGRLASVVVAGIELLINEGETHPMQWGSYPMAPFAGRIRQGRFTFRGREHLLPQGMPPHAIHGMVYDRPWRVDGPDGISIDIDDRWPFRGRVSQRFALDEDGLRVEMTLEAAEPMPATIGWHPWFRRRLVPGDEPVTLRLHASEMLVRGSDDIPTGVRIAPPPGPWDDAFTGLQEDPALEWPGRLRLVLSSTCPWWVVYSKPEHAICVEPESGPPNALNLAPDVVEPGSPLTHTMRWRWTRLGSG